MCLMVVIAQSRAKRAHVIKAVSHLPEGEEGRREKGEEIERTCLGVCI